MVNQSSFAQSDVIRGVVVDEENRPLPGANIVIASLNTGVITDLDGAFRMTLPTASSYSLEISFLGYQGVTRQVDIPQNEPLRVVLQQIALETEGVTIYGALTRGQAKALNDQRNAPNVRNVVSSEQFAIYPDVSLAETV